MKKQFQRFSNKLLFRLFIGFRYVRKKRTGKRINIITFFLFLGLSGGLTILIVVLGIMNGFQDNHISRRIEIGSYHVSIYPNDKLPFSLKESLALKEELYSQFPFIEAAVPYADREVIIHLERRRYTEEQIIKLRAVDPDEIKKDSRFLKYFNVEYGEMDLSPYSILPGTQLGYKILAKVGSTINLTPSISLASLKSDGVPFTAQGFYYTGSYDYDRYWGFISIYSLIPLTGKADIDAIGIKFSSLTHKREKVKQLRQWAGDKYEVLTAEEINRGYFNALKLEKIMIIFLFVMIFLMVAANIFGALKLTIIEKKLDIAILKALGAHPRDIEMIFIIESLILGFTSCIAGIGLGLLIAYNIGQIFKLAELVINSILNFIVFALENIIPGVYLAPVELYDETIYYQSGFLVKMQFPEMLTIAFFIIMMTLAAAYIPVRRASRLKPNEVIHS